MIESIQLDLATQNDAQELLNIYAYYVKQTAITFEYTVPSLEQFQERIRHTLTAYPYLVAKRKNEILGFAYTGPFNKRAAYQWNVETSIYLKQGDLKKGGGALLYRALEQLSRAQNIVNLNACLSYHDLEDVRLPKSSYYFHQRRGFKQVAHFHQCGYKFDRWYDMIWMEKRIQTPPPSPKPFIPFPDLDPSVFINSIKR